MVANAPEALMHAGAGVTLIAAMVSGCNAFGVAENVRSSHFPWIDIRCEGDAQVAGDKCLRWAEQSLANGRGIAIKSSSVVVAFHTADDGTRCSASTSFYRADGHLVLKVGKACPADDGS
jgi:hypothetical protein